MPSARNLKKRFTPPRVPTCEKEEQLIQLCLRLVSILQVYVIFKRSLQACSQLSFNILFCYPLYTTRLQRPCVFWTCNTARLPPGCSIFDLSVSQRIPIASAFYFYVDLFCPQSMVALVEFTSRKVGCLGELDIHVPWIIIKGNTQSREKYTLAG